MATSRTHAVPAAVLAALVITGCSASGHGTERFQALNPDLAAVDAPLPGPGAPWAPHLLRFRPLPRPRLARPSHHRRRPPHRRQAPQTRRWHRTAHPATRPPGPLLHHTRPPRATHRGRQPPRTPRAPPGDPLPRRRGDPRPPNPCGRASCATSANSGPVGRPATRSAGRAARPTGRSRLLVLRTVHRRGGRRDLARPRVAARAARNRYRDQPY